MGVMVWFGLNGSRLNRGPMHGARFGELVAGDYKRGRSRARACPIRGWSGDGALCELRESVARVCGASGIRDGHDSEHHCAAYAVADVLDGCAAADNQAARALGSQVDVDV